MKIIMTALMVLAVYASASAHAIWIETAQKGTSGKQHEAKIFLGEFAANERDEISKWFNNMATFTLYVVTPDGQKTELKTEAKGNYFSASFVPKTDGIYYLTIDQPVDQIYDGAKIYYHAQAKVQVGKSEKGAENILKLNEAIIKQDGVAYKQGIAVPVTMSYKNAVIPGSKLNIQSTEGWAKEIEADANSMVSFKPMWKDAYLMEGTFTEETTGTHKDQEYKVVWHCVTNWINVD